MKNIKFNQVMLVMFMTAFVGCLCAAPAQGGLWLRMTFNAEDGSDSGGSSSYYGDEYNISYVSSPGGKAARFEDPNSDSYFNITDGGSNLLPDTIEDNGMSMAYWLKANVEHDSYLSLLTTGTNGVNMPDSIQHSLCYPSGGSPPYTTRRFYDYGWWISPPYPTGTWYHLVYTYEPLSGSDPNMTTNVYLDGNLIGTQSRGILDPNDSTARLGILYNTSLREPFGGDIDQFEIYDNTLSVTDVNTLYADGPIGPTLNPWLHLTFNDSDGSDANSTGFSDYYGDLYAISIVDSPGGKAARFVDPNSDSYAILTDGASVLLPDTIEDNGMSMAYWLKANVEHDSYMSLLTTGTNGTNTPDSIQHSLCYPSGGTPPYTTRRFYDYPWWLDSYPTGTWYHLVYTYEPLSGSDPNMTTNVYVDGNLIGTQSRGILDPNDRTARLGILYNTSLREPFGGDIDQFSIFDKTLNVTDVNSLYAEGPEGYVPSETPPDANTPWLRLTFNSVTGNTVPNEGGTSSYYGQAIDMDWTGAAGDKKAVFADPNSNSYINITNGTTDFLPSTIENNGLTVAYWLKANVEHDSYMSLLTTGTNGGNMPDSIQHSLCYPSGGSPPYTSRRFYDFLWWISPAFDVSTWYHLVYTYEPASGSDPNMTTNVYLDGNLIGTQSRGILVPDDYSAMLGILNNAGFKEPFGGQLDQFEIYTATLDVNDVNDLYVEGPITIDNRVEAPQFSPEAGTYIGTESMTLTSDTAGATIYYTTDGSTPTPSSTEYSGPFDANSIFTLKAYAIKATMDDSVVNTGAYTIYFQSADFLANRPKTFINDNRIIWLDVIQYDDDQLFYNTKISQYQADATSETFTLTTSGDLKPIIRSLSLVSDGTVVNPWVLTDSNNCIDSYSPNTVAFDLLTLNPGMTDQQKAIAVFEYFVEIQFWDALPIEYIEGQAGYGVVPGAIVNCTGYATCGHQGPLMIPYLLEIGLPDARKRRFGPDSTTIFHSTTEAYYDSAWHILDLTQLAYYLKSDDSSLASCAELISDSSLIERMSGDDRFYDPTWVYAIGQAAKYGWEFEASGTGMPGNVYEGWMYPPQRLPDITLGPTQKFSRMNANEGSYWQAWDQTDPYTTATEITRRRSTLPEYFGNGFLEYELDPNDSSFTTLVPAELRIFFDEFLDPDENYKGDWPTSSGSPECTEEAVDEVSPWFSLHLLGTEYVQSKVIDLSAMTSVDIEYNYQLDNTENNDDLYSEYWDGDSWELIENHGGGGAEDVWNNHSETLPAGAYIAGFKMRFRADGGAADEWHIDDVSLTDNTGGRNGLTIGSGSPPCRPTSQGTPGIFILPIDSSHTIIDLEVSGDFCRPDAGDTVNVSYSTDFGESFTSLFTVSSTGASVTDSNETPILRGMYNVLVKFTFNSSTASPCGLNSVSVKARLQNNPRVIPPLEIGSNNVYYSSDSQTADVNVAYIYVERQEIPISIDWENLKPGCLDAVFFCDTSNAVTTTIPITMTNVDSGSLTITPSVSYTPSGWTMTLSDANAIVLAADASKDLILSCTPPASNPEGAVGAELNFYTSTYGNAHKRMIIAAVDSFISLQAEDANTLSEMAIDPNMEGDSGTSIILTSAYEGGGYARFHDVTVPHTDSYYVAARFNAVNTNYKDADQVKIIVDGNTRVLNRWLDTTSRRKQDHFVDRWTWWRHNTPISLTAGTCTIDVYGLKDDIYIDSLVLVSTDVLLDTVLMNQLYCPVGFDEAIAD